MARTALIRTLIEAGRVEMRATKYDAAIAKFNKAITICQDTYGKDCIEAGELGWGGWLAGQNIGWNRWACLSLFNIQGGFYAATGSG